MSSTVYNSVDRIWRGPDFPTWLFNEKANLGRIIVSVLNRNPKKVAQISDNNGIRMTNKEMVSDMVKIAGGLKIRGCTKGDVIGFVARNSHNLAPTIFACFLLEAIPQGMDITQEEGEIYHMFQMTDPKFVFCDDDKVNVVQRVLQKLQSSAIIILFGSKQGSYLHIEDLMKEGDINIIKKKVYEDSCKDSEIKYHILCSSSGTTGPPKGVCIRYPSLVDYDWDLRNSISSSSDCLFSFSPIFWTVGYVVLFRSLFQGITRIITTDTFNPELYLHIVRKYKVTHTLISPLYISNVLKSPRFTPTSLSSLKNMWCVGSLVTEDLAKKVYQCVPRGVLEVVYGMSEIGLIAKYLYDPKIPMSVGHLAPSVEAIIIDEDGNKLIQGETGELCLRAQYQLLGYFKNPKATKDLIDVDDFVHTGDVGFFDEDGFLRIVGRRKDLIKYYMFHVSCGEIEKIIATHPGVAQVSVVGIPDPQCYQLPAAVVVKKPTSSLNEDEVIDLIASRLPDPYKLRGGVYFVDKLPMTFSAKLKKVEVEKMAEEMYLRKINLSSY
ncbi:hypothetical protein DMENIID0001_047770 [Sergentomyia squamirostris]